MTTLTVGRDRRAAVRARAQPGAGQHERGEAGVGVADERRGAARRAAGASRAPARSRRTAARARRRCAPRRSSASTRAPAARRPGARAARGRRPGGAGAPRAPPRRRAARAGRRRSSLDELGDPGDPLATTGRPAAHRLHQHDRDALAPALPRSARWARRGRRRGAARPRPPRACARRPARRGPQPGRARSRARARARSGPSPTRRQRTSTPSAASSRQASTRCAWPLTSCSVPTHRMRQRPAGRPRAVAAGANRRVSTPARTTCTCRRSARRTPATISRRLSCRDGGHERRLGHLLGQHRRSTCRSEPCAVKLNGIPVSRRMTKPATAGWLAKWQCTWATPSACIRRAAWATFGKKASAPAKKFGLPQVPRATSASARR